MTPRIEDAGRRREVRRFVRGYHPDAGGDPAVFAAGLAALQAPAQTLPTAPDTGAGSYAARWPDWVRDDDPRLAARLCFHRRRRGLTGLIGGLIGRR